MLRSALISQFKNSKNIQRGSKKKRRVTAASHNNINKINLRKKRVTVNKNYRKQKWKEKQLYGYFKRQIKEISHEMTRICLRRGNVKRETESLLISAQNIIKTNYIKAKIDNTQKNSNCRLCSDKDGTVNPTISECNKLTQKKYRHIYVGKGIYWELGERLKFHKWTNQNLAQKNKPYKILWGFVIQTDYLISPRKLDFVLINKKKIIYLVPADH